MFKIVDYVRLKNSKGPKYESKILDLYGSNAAKLIMVYNNTEYIQFLDVLEQIPDLEIMQWLLEKI